MAKKKKKGKSPMKRGGAHKSSSAPSVSKMTSRKSTRTTRTALRTKPGGGR